MFKFILQKKYFLIFSFIATQCFSQTNAVWVQKINGGGLGDPFAYNPQNHNTVYCASGNNIIYRSLDRGRTWHSYDTVSNGNQIKFIAVHPSDTLSMVVGQEAGPPDRIMKTTNGGQTWFHTWSGNFSYYGRPIAYEPNHRDLMYTEGGDTLYKSVDFGSTWQFVRRTNDVGGTGVGFNSWDCAVIRPDNDKILYVGDNGNGLWKSTDGGMTWTQKHLHSGEYPILVIDHFEPRIAYAARWGGVRGFMKTSDGGDTWYDIPQLNNRNTWGLSVSLENPGYVYVGTYGEPLNSTGGVYISRNYGETFIRTSDSLTSGSNYAVLAIDSMNIYALQANGIWKLRFPGTISGIVFNDENGNGIRDSSEGTLEDFKIRLTGVKKDSLLSNENGEYRFQLVKPGNYSAIIIPPAKWISTSPANGTHTVTLIDGEHFTEKNFGVVWNAPMFAVDKDTIVFTSVFIDSLVSDSFFVQNLGTVPLVISSITTTDSAFSVVPNFDTLAAHSQKKYSVSFSSSNVGVHSAHIIFTHNADTLQDSVFVVAEVVTDVKEERNLLPSNTLLLQNYPNPFNPTTTIRFSLSTTALVSLKVYDALGREVAELLKNEVKNKGMHNIEFDATNVPSGMYFYQLVSENEKQTRKLLLLK
ncbi:MAG: T9SS type A sorting domain-containing protein [Ignavibacteria bacterium]|nr:T9SS type A sorting domain-containing protein [Ignavibacteria bacterium]